jgi:hypothetical protein
VSTGVSAASACGHITDFGYVEGSLGDGVATQVDASEGVRDLADEAPSQTPVKVESLACTCRELLVLGREEASWMYLSAFPAAAPFAFTTTSSQYP